MRLRSVAIALLIVLVLIAVLGIVTVASDPWPDDCPAPPIDGRTTIDCFPDSN